MNDIKQILVDGQGWKYSKEGKFEWTGYNGHMAKLPWIRQTTPEGIKEYNINYVVQIEYFNDSTQQQLSGSPSAHPND
jgi:hypothetical protein